MTPPTAVSSSTDAADSTGTASGSDTEEMLSSATDMNVLYNKLLIATTPEIQGAGTDIALDQTVSFSVDGYVTNAEYTFTPPYDHSYTIKYTYSSGYSPVKILDPDGKQIHSGWSHTTYSVDLKGGVTYTFSLYNDYSSARTIHITPSLNSNCHIFEDGVCGCGEIEPELSGTCGSGLTWTYKNNVLTISGSGAMTNYGSGSAPWYSNQSVRNSTKAVVIEEGVTSIGANAFYNFKNLTGIVIPDSVTSLGTYAFAGSSSLENVVFGENIKKIPSYTFQSCPALSEFTIPESIESIENYAFQDCSGLADLIIDNPNLAAVSSTAFSGCKNMDTLTFTENVDVVSVQLIDSLANAGTALENPVFKGENYINVEKIFSSIAPVYPGDYYVDANGALYLLDKEKGTATLSRVPEGIENYTVPDTIPSENGGKYNVIGVEDNAIKTASDLVSLDFAAPEKITYLPAGSLSNCPALESVNGKTTVDEAYDTFNNKDLAKYDYLFYNTGLERSGEKTDDELSLVGQNPDLLPLIRVITGKNSGEGNPDFKGTFDYYTNEPAKLSVAISNANAGDYDAVRVYIAFDNDGGQLSWPLGTHSVQTESGKKYDLTVAESDVENVYYIECKRIDAGDTVSANLTLLYPSPTTGGGKAKIWPVILDNGELEQVGNSVVAPEKYNEVEWHTKPDDFSLSKSRYSSNTSTDSHSGWGVGGRGDDGRIYLHNLQYTVTQGRIGNTLLGIGKDHMKSVDFVDTLTLPEGMHWHEDVLDAVRNGTYTVTYSGSYLYFYADVDGVNHRILTVYMNGTNLQYIAGSVKLEVNENEDIVTRFSLRNTAVNSSEMNTITARIYYDSDISRSYSRGGYNYTDQQTFIYVDADHLDDEFTVLNEIDNVQHFCYSEDQTDHSEVSYKVDAGKTDFVPTKKWIDSPGYWGDMAYYEVGILNQYAYDYPGILDMYDPLHRYLYIKPENIQKMFDEAAADKENIKSLTITIEKATLCNDTAEAHTPGAVITDTSGKTHTLIQNNTGLGTEYNGLETEDPAAHTTDATIVLTCTAADGKQTLTLNGNVLDATNIHAALEAVGYVVTSEAKYTVKWDFIDGYVLESDTHYTRNIYSNVKDTFMLLVDDEWNYNRDYSDVSIPYNYIYVDYLIGDGKTSRKDTYVGYTYPDREFFLYKDYSIGGVADAEIAEIGDVIDYKLKVQHSGEETYYTLPLTDHMTGGQVMLVPVKGNDHLAETYGLTPIKIDRVSYYPINKVGTYKNVNTGGRIADSIVVTPMPSGGFDTLIRWYLPDIKGNKTVNIDYKALVDPAVTGVSDMQFYLDNETWLNDHQSHRLYDTIGGEGEALIGSQVKFDKYIVTDKGSTPAEDALAVYSRFEEGKPTTYRLSITNTAGGVVDISGDDIYDSLPKTRHEVYKWSKDNIRMVAVPAKEGDFTFTFNDGNMDSAWYIDSTPPSWTGVGEHEDQQYIRWDEDFTIHLSGTIYFYVTIDMAEGSDWIDNAVKYRETILENSFYVREKKMTVTHDLAIEAEAYLQKGVMANRTNPYSDAYFDKKHEDARFYYINSTNGSTSSGFSEYIGYYIVLYNSGHTRLYLNPIQDYLPQGFSCSGTYNFGYYLSTSPSISLYDAEGNKLSPKWKSASITRKYTSGDRHVTFDLYTNNTGSSYLKYDEFFDKYYLAPNEGIYIYYYAKVGVKGTTEEVATNYAAMPYFDYLGQGVRKSDITITGPTTHNHKLNDGTCTLTDTAYAGTIGMTGGGVATEWLESHVTLTPGEIVPGITKHAKSVTRTNGTVVNNPETAGSEDIVNWEIMMTNTGTDDLVNYTFTDVMNGDYGFVGDVSINRAYSNFSGSSSYYGQLSGKLFTIIRDEDDPDKITLEYQTGSGSSTKTAVEFTRGEKIDINPYIASSYNSGNAEISVGIRVDENRNEILEIDMLSDRLLIPSYGTFIVNLSTKNFGTWENKVYYNNAYLTPNEQVYNSELVSQGNHLLFGDDKDPSVRNTAQITAAYGYVTTSEKRIREIGNETNCASSKDDKNWIFLDEHKDTFRYTNIVNNVTGKALTKFVMIDNLPQVGDHETFAATEPRYSAFKVELTENPQFEVSMVVGDTKTVLAPDQYEIMFSDRTEFSEKDWDDSSDSGWYSTRKKSTRSFRISIYDDTGTTIPDTASIQVEYNGRIIMADDYNDDEVTTDPIEGTIAWNSFGYHYKVLGEPLSLEAAPLKVGICIKYIPVLQKSLVYPDGTPYVAEEDETFRYLIYSGSSLSNVNSGRTEAQISSTLKSNNRKAIVVSVDVKAGESVSDLLELNNSKSVTYDTASGTWVENGDWSFMDGQVYTVYELEDPDSMFKFKSTGTSAANNYSFTFDGMKLAAISGVNVRKTWNVRINKVDAAEGKPLSGAYFGIYSPSQKEAISQNNYDAIPLLTKPAKTIKHGGKTWYLTQVTDSGESGTALFTGLIEENYIAKELRAPGGYKLKKDIYEFSLEDADDTLSVITKVDNEADYELPKTGTKEAASMMVWGNVLMLIAFAVLAVKKHLERREQN